MERSEAIANDSILEGSDFGTDGKKLADLRQRSEQAGKWQRLLRVSPSSDLADLSQVLQPCVPLVWESKEQHLHSSAVARTHVSPSIFFSVREET